MNQREVWNASFMSCFGIEISKIYFVFIRKVFLQNIEKFHNNQWLICITVEKVKLGTVLCINVAPRPHRLETRVVIKISTHPCLTAFNGIKQAKNAFFVFFASKKTFPLIIWIFTEGDGIESRLPFYHLFYFLWKQRNKKEK